MTINELIRTGNITALVERVNASTEPNLNMSRALARSAGGQHGYQV